MEARGPEPKSSLRTRNAESPVGIRSHKFDHTADGRIPVKHFLNVFKTLLKCAFLRKQKAIGLAKRVNLLAFETVPLQADDVKPRKIGPVADGHAKWDDIVLNAGHASDKRVSADADPLMDGGKAAQNGVIADGYVPRERGA